MLRLLLFLYLALNEITCPLLHKIWGNAGASHTMLEISYHEFRQKKSILFCQTASLSLLPKLDLLILEAAAEEDLLLFMGRPLQCSGRILSPFHP